MEVGVQAGDGGIRLELLPEVDYYHEGRDGTDDHAYKPHEPMEKD